MKINQLTSALIGLGIISAASAAHATNPVLYLTGSTAARSFVFNACTTPGQVFLATTSSPAAGANPSVVSPSPNNVGSGNLFVVEGYVNVGGTATLVDLDCSFTGSEAGIASVAGQPLTQRLPADPNGAGPYSLPGVGSSTSFLVGPGWTTTSPLPIASGVSVPDLTMADTSQAVSFTPASSFPLKDYGIVGIVPFTWMKGYESGGGDPAWNNCANVTLAQMNVVIGSSLPAGFITGVAADSLNDTAEVCGRNLGSGTRANCLLTHLYGVTKPVDQFAYNTGYPTSPVSAQGTLTFNGSFAVDGSGGEEVFNDGFDSGSSVQKVMNVDGNGNGVLLLGYMGVSDAKNAFNHTSGGGAAAYLKFNGVYESDLGVEQGTYEFWGQEHVLGHNSPPTTTLAVGSALKSGIAAQLISSGAGTATGDVSSNPAQSVLIPTVDMQVTRGADSGFPIYGTF